MSKSISVTGLRCDLLAGIRRPMHAEQRFLHHVLGLGDATEHPVADREGDRPQFVEQSLAIGSCRCEPLPPARLRRAPPEFALGLCIGSTAGLGHHHHTKLPGRQPND
jgi:hypothetical protein